MTDTVKRQVGRAGQQGGHLFRMLIDNRLVLQNSVTIEAFGKRSSATLIKGSAYDSKREKILC